MAGNPCNTPSVYKLISFVPMSITCQTFQVIQQKYLIPRKMKISLLSLLVSIYASSNVCTDGNHVIEGSNLFTSRQIEVESRLLCHAFCRYIQDECFWQEHTKTCTVPHAAFITLDYGGEITGLKVRTKSICNALCSISSDCDHWNFRQLSTSRHTIAGHCELLTDHAHVRKCHRTHQCSCGSMIKPIVNQQPVVESQLCRLHSQWRSPRCRFLYRRFKH